MYTCRRVRTIPWSKIVIATAWIKRLAMAAVVVLPLTSFSIAAEKRQPILINWSDLGIRQSYDQGAAPVQDGFGLHGDKHTDVFAEAGGDVARILVQSPSDVELLALSDNSLRERYARDIERLIREYLNRKAPITKFDLQLIENIGALGYFSGKPDAEHTNPNRQDLVDRFGKIAYGALSEVVTRLATANDVTLRGSLGSNGTSMWARTAAWAPMQAHIAAVTLTDGRAKVPDVLEALHILDPAKLRIIVNRRDLWAPSDSIGRLSGAEQVLGVHHSVTLLLADKIKGELGQNHISPLTEAGAEFRISRVFADQTRQNLPNMTRQDLFPFYANRDWQSISGNEARSGSHPMGPPPSDGCDTGARHSCAPFILRRDDPPLPPSRPPPPVAEPLAPTPPRGSGKTGPGGIDLSSPARIAEAQFPPIEAVVLDPNTGSVILVGHPSLSGTVGATGSDLALALWLSFGPAPQDLQFSLDPADPKDPGGKWIKAVYSPEAVVKGREAGITLFEGDLRLKELAFQVRHNPENKIETWKPALPGFKSYVELAMEAPAPEQARDQWTRFWIVISDATVKEEGGIIAIDPQMAVEARRQVTGGPTGLRDVETPSDTIESEWARLVTRHYDELGHEAPELIRIKQLAAAVLCAKALKSLQVPIDLDQIIQILNADHAQRTVERMAALSVTWTKTNRTENARGIQIETRRLHLFGGVDLTATPRLVRGDASVGALGQKVLDIFRSANSHAQVLTFRYEGELMQATSLPLLLKH